MLGTGAHDALDQVYVIRRQPDNVCSPSCIDSLDHLQALTKLNEAVLHVVDQQVKTSAHHDLGNHQMAKHEPRANS